jgi:hypothetical protein
MAYHDFLLPNREINVLNPSVGPILLRQPSPAQAFWLGLASACSGLLVWYLLGALGVWSRHEVTWIYFEDIGRCGPGVADSFEWCSPLQRFEVLGKIIGTRKQERVP